MDKFQSINRLMGTRQEKFYQHKNGDFEDTLQVMLDSIDPYWQDRDRLEMDIFHHPAPLTVNTSGEEPELEEVATARPYDPFREEEHEYIRFSETLASKLVPFAEQETLEEIEDA